MTTDAERVSAALDHLIREINRLQLALLERTRERDAAMLDIKRLREEMMWPGFGVTSSINDDWCIYDTPEDAIQAAYEHLMDMIGCNGDDLPVIATMTLMRARYCDEDDVAEPGPEIRSWRVEVREGAGDLEIHELDEEDDHES